MPTTQFIIQLDTHGNGTGDTNAIGDYSTIGKHFHWISTDETMLVQRMTVYIRASGPLSSDKYGANLTLVNGIKALYIAEGKTFNITRGAEIFNNADWAKNGGNLKELNFSGGTKKSVVYNWEVVSPGLRLRKDEIFSVLLTDDFTGLLEHYFRITGVIST